MGFLWSFVHHWHGDHLFGLEVLGAPGAAWIGLDRGLVGPRQWVLGVGWLRAPLVAAHSATESQVDPGVGTAVQTGQKQDDGKWCTCNQTETCVKLVIRWK